MFTFCYNLIEKKFACQDFWQDEGGKQLDVRHDSHKNWRWPFANRITKIVFLQKRDEGETRPYKDR